MRFEIDQPTADPDADVRQAALHALNARVRQRPDRRATAFLVRKPTRPDDFAADTASRQSTRTRDGAAGTTGRSLPEVC
jgi:hypothetical protein